MEETYVMKQNRIFIIAEYFIITLLLLTVATSSNTIKLVVIGYILISFCFKNKMRIVYDLVWYFPFYNMFKLGGVGISYYNILMLMASLIIILLKKTTLRTRRTTNLIIILAAIALYSILISLVNGQSVAFGVLVDVVMPMFTVITLLTIDYDGDSFLTIVWLYSLALIVAGIAGSSFVSLPGVQSYLDPNAYRFGSLRFIRLQGLSGNPNYYSVDLNIAISLNLVVNNLFKKATTKRISITCVLLLTIIGLMTFSKSFIITGVITIVLYLGYELLARRKAGSIWKLLILIFVGVTIIYALDSVEMIKAVFARFSESGDDIGNFTSGRTVIWITYIDYMLENPVSLFLGFGLNAPKLQVGSIYYPTHNLILEMLYSVGIAGGVLYMYFYKMLLFNKFTKYFYCCFPILIFFVRSLAVNMLYREAIFIQLFLLAINVRIVTQYYMSEELC